MHSSRPRHAAFRAESPPERGPAGARRRHCAALAFAVRATLLGASALTVVPVLVAPAHAADTTSVPAERRFDIPAGPLSRVVNQFAAEAGVQVSVDAALTANLTSPGLKGSYSVQSGFASLLAGTGLVAVSRGDGEYTLRKAPLPRGGDAENVATLSPVIVTARPARAGDLPGAYAGGQVARGGQLGVLGNVNVMDAPLNITSYTAQRIQDAQAQSLDAILADDPSVRALSSGYVGQQFSIRGMGPTGGASFNAVSFQGMFGVAPDYRTPMELVERVEIIKGPTAFLNGFSPFTINGGAVNLVPKRATDQPVNQVGLSYSPDAHWGTRADVGRRFGEDKRWGIRVNGSLEDGEASIEQSDRLRLGGMALDYRGERLRASLDLMDQDVAQRGLISYPSFRPGAAIPRAPDASIGGIFLPGAGSQRVRD
ncbi:MAG: TonB-dependent receptor plug domain-containing protein, partial [Lautropia sp.]